MDISVIIPTYKPKEYLWECLYSLEAQKLSKSKFEVLLILNGVRDPFYSQIKRFISTLSVHIYLFYTEFSGVSNARNIGLNNAKGQYITFIDDDDLISPDYLLELLKIVDSETIALARPFAFNDGTQSKEIEYSIANTYKKYYNKGRLNFSLKIRNYFNGPWMKLIPRKIIEDSTFNTDYKNGEDSLFMFEISRNAKKVAFASPNVIYYRRFRINSATSLLKNHRYLIKNSIRIIISYSKIYFHNPFKYNSFLYLRQVLATIKTLLVHIKADNKQVHKSLK